MNVPTLGFPEAVARDETAPFPLVRDLAGQEPDAKRFDESRALSDLGSAPVGCIILIIGRFEFRGPDAFIEQLCRVYPVGREVRS
jgi:hypothetical protein